MRVRRNRQGSSRLEYSDATNTFVEVERLVWAKRKELLPAATNALLHSDYNATTWTASSGEGTDEGTISIGVYADRAISHYDLSNNHSMTGVQTWGGDYTLLTTATIANSGHTKACFSCIVGAHHLEDNPGARAYLDILDGAGNSLGTTEAAFNGMIRPFVVADVTGIAAIRVQLDVYTNTDGSKWFAEQFQLEWDRTSPGEFVVTTGTAVSRATPQASFCVAKVETEEVERVVEDWEKTSPPKGDPRYPTVRKTAF